MSYIYSELKADVAGYLHRTDLTAQIPGFIETARSRIARDVRTIANLTVGTFTSVADYISVPSTSSPFFVQARRLTDLSRSNDLDEIPIRQAAFYTALDIPAVFAVSAPDAIWIPGSGTGANFDLEYWFGPDVLSSDASSSVGMNEWPQIWISAAVAQGHLYSQNIEGYQTFRDLYQAEVAAENLRARITLSIAPATISAIRLSNSPARL